MDRLEVKRQQIRGVFEDLNRLSQGSHVQVGQIMTVAPTCIRPDQSVFELVKLFKMKGFRHLLVTDEQQRLIGVVSDRDVIRCFGPLENPSKHVLSGILTSQIMSDDLLTVSPETPLERALHLMIDHGISCLPVLAGDVLVGILTNTDLQIVLSIQLEGNRSQFDTDLPAEMLSNRQD